MSYAHSVSRASVSIAPSIAKTQKEIKEIDSRIKKIAITNFLLLGICIAAFNILARPIMIVLGIAQCALWITLLALKKMRNEKQTTIERKPTPTSVSKEERKEKVDSSEEVDHQESEDESSVSLSDNEVVVTLSLPNFQISLFGLDQDSDSGPIVEELDSSDDETQEEVQQMDNAEENSSVEELPPAAIDEKFNIPAFLTSIKENDPCIWDQLIALKDHIVDGKLRFIDEHKLDRQEKNVNDEVNAIVIVQRFDSKEKDWKIPKLSWICPLEAEDMSRYIDHFDDANIECKNPIKLKNDVLTLSTSDQGYTLQKKDIAKLNEFRICIQEDGHFGLERNIKVTVQEILDLVK